MIARSSPRVRGNKVRGMKPIGVLVLLTVLAGCGSTSTSSSKDAAAKSPGSMAAVCVEVRAGIASYNAQDLDNVQPHFVKAEVVARKYAETSGNSQADDLLEAVKYFAAVPPANYSKDAGARKLFQKYKAVTLGYCEQDGGSTTTDPVRKT